MNDGRQLRFEVKENSFTVGRSQKCRIVIPDDKLSREHCLFDVDAGHIFITDLGSSNGVYVSGKRLEAHVRTFYRPGQALTIGNSKVSVREEAGIEIEDELNLTPQKEIALATMPNIPAAVSPAYRMRNPARNPVLRTPRERPEVKEKRTSMLGVLMFLLFGLGIYYYHTVAKPQMARGLKGAPMKQER